MGNSGERGKGFLGKVGDAAANEVGRYLGDKVIKAFGGRRGEGAQPQRPRAIDWGDRMKQDARDRRAADREAGKSAHTPGGSSYSRNPETGRIDRRTGSFGEPAKRQPSGSPLKRVE